MDGGVSPYRPYERGNEEKITDFAGPESKLLCRGQSLCCLGVKHPSAVKDQILLL
jgi:hypothetical protein